MDSLVKHLNKFHKMQDPEYGESYTCDICSSQLKTLKTVKWHMLAHMFKHKKGSVKCDVCKKVYSNDYALKHHMKIHKKDRPCEICPICGKTYFLGSLKVHLRTHEEQGEIKCDDCPMIFSSVRRLRIHSRRKHSGEIVRYYCDMCGASYADKETLKEHLNKHLNIFPFSCEFCDKKFHKREYYKQHVGPHTDNECTVAEILAHHTRTFSHRQ
jgi:KRAB domain-containing zinc finger protein